MTRLLTRAAAACLAALFLFSPAGSANGQEPYRILLTNDDGIRAPGLAALAQALKPLGEVTIIAPSENHSGTGHGLVLSDPIYVDRVDIGGQQATSLTATPAACVRVALSTLLTTKPHIVVSGVNRGSNFGLNAYISGTVAAAREAAMHGIPAVAASLDISGHPHYGPSAEATAKVVAIVKAGGLPKGVFLNVNIPAGTEFKGLKLSRQSNQMGTERFEETRTPYGRRVLWSFFMQPKNAEPDSDVQAALDGYVAVTPLVASEFSQSGFDELQKRIR